MTTDNNLSYIVANLNNIKLKLAKLTTEPVTIVAISKQQPREKVTELLTFGHKHFGESRIQETLTKWQDLKEEFSGVRLHLIGHLQRNKIKEALKIFDVIETIDSLHLAEALANELAKQQRKSDIEFYVQVNTGKEPQKHGVMPEATSDLIYKCMSELNLRVTGLMCIPPYNKDPQPHFATLKSIAAEHKLPILSMGMSNDFELATRMGATHIRVGTAIFGERSS